MNHYSYRKTEFDPGYEEYVRGITNANGRGNAAYNMDHEREMLPQDKLLYADISLGLTTGMAVEFGWESGRKDVYAVLDLAVDSVRPEVIEERKALVEQLKKEHANAQKPH